MWKPNVEMMPRKEIEKKQEKKLKAQLKYVYINSAFYNEKFGKAGIKPEDVKSLADLEKLPLTTRDELAKKVSPEDPFSGRCCTSEDKLWCVCTPPEQEIKGSPVYTAYTEDDRDALVDHMLRNLMMVGLIRGMRVEIQASLNELIHRLLERHFMVHRAVQEVFPFTSIPIESSFMTLDLPRMMYLTKFFKPDLLITTTDVAKSLTDEVKKGGETPKDAFGCKIVVHRARFGNPVLTSEQRNEFVKDWGGKHFSMLDVQDNGFFATECSEFSGLHAWEDAFIVEVVDEKTGKSLADGEKGKLTVTNLFAEGTPLIRYMTGYDAKITKETCGCGRTHVRIFLL